MGRIEIDPRISMRTARQSIVAPLDLDFVDMNSICGETLRRMLDADQRELEQCRRELSEPEQYCLYIKKTRGKLYYYQAADGGDTMQSISDDPDRINKLARRKYLEKKVLELEVNLSRLKAAIDSYEHRQSAAKTRRVLEYLRDAGIDLTRIIFTEEQNRWIDAAYSPNPFHTENLTKRTNGGIWMRSRAEVLIGNELERRGIPYRYDDIVEVSGPDRENPNALYRKSYFADFKIPNLRRGISVNEHLGATHLQGYGDNAIVRINDYDWYHAFDRSEVFWTLDSDVLDPERMDRAIRTMLLPNI